MFTAWFEAGSYSTKEIEDQMEVFAAEVMPVLRRECGGGPKLQESTVQCVPDRVLAGVAGLQGGPKRTASVSASSSKELASASKGGTPHHCDDDVPSAAGVRPMSGPLP